MYGCRSSRTADQLIEVPSTTFATEQILERADLLAARDLAGVLPRAAHIEFDGLGHAGSWNPGRGSRREVVAAALRDFFA
jgi:hypothetical protein